MNESDHFQFSEEEVLEALPAYVLGALEPDELLFIDEYVREHPELQARIHDLELVASDLTFAAPPVEVPSSIKAQVMARVRAEPHSHGVVTDAPHVAGPSPASAELSWMDRLRTWWRRGGKLQVSVATAGLAVLALVAVIISSQASLRWMDATIAGYVAQIGALEAEVAELQDTNASLMSQLDASTQQVATITQPDRTLLLGGTNEMPAARAALYVRGSMGVLVTRGLAMLEENQTYQLWLIPPSGEPQPAGLIGQGSDAGATITIEIEPASSQFSAVGISIEPAGGSQSPTGPIVLFGETT